MSKEFIFELDNALYNEETGEAVFKPKVKGELVRCGECKYAMRTSETGKVLGCKHFKWKSRGLRTENDYCSYGERKDGEHDGET